MKLIKLSLLGAGLAAASWFLVPAEEIEPATCDAEAADHGETAAASPATESVALDESPTEWQAPFPEQVDPFSVPSLDAPREAIVDDSESGQVAVRVIGFVNVEGSGPAAILDIGGAPIIASVGETVSGIEVVGISDPDVTLQRLGDRWSVNLFDDIVDTSQVALANSDYPGGAGRPSAGAHVDGPVSRISPTSDPGSSAPAIPDLDDDLPSIELPELDDLPEFTEPSGL